MLGSGAALNNTGSLASRANVELDAVTLLTNNGNAQIGAVLSLLSKQDLVNTGHLVADSGIQFVADQGSITNRGALENNAGPVSAFAVEKLLSFNQSDPSSGGIQLTSGANLINTAELSTSSDLLLHAGKDLSSSAALTALGKADIAAGGNLSLSGSLVTGDDIQALAIGSATLQGSIQSSAGIAVQAGTDLWSSAALSAPNRYRPGGRPGYHAGLDTRHGNTGQFFDPGRSQRRDQRPRLNNQPGHNRSRLHPACQRRCTPGRFAYR
jgi:hypothetical protein